MYSRAYVFAEGVTRGKPDYWDESPLDPPGKTARTFIFTWQVCATRKTLELAP